MTKTSKTLTGAAATGSEPPCVAVIRGPDGEVIGRLIGTDPASEAVKRRVVEEEDRFMRNLRCAMPEPL